MMSSKSDGKYDQKLSNILGQATLNVIGSSEMVSKNGILYVETAIEIDPTYKAFWNNLSIAYYAIGEKRKAIDCFKEAL